MPPDFQKPTDFDLWNHMRTINEFRLDTEKELPELRKELNAVRAEVAEILLCVSIVKRIVPWFWAAVLGIAGISGTIIGMLYKLIPPGALK